MKKNIPTVSIIIPMYNVEKYVGECLDSILNQTFQDFEVIVVDDCSTDNSRAVVESYLPKFNGGGVKLKLICSKKNSGGRPGIPRNTGIRLSRGEYILFVDSDDAIIPTALEELYPLSKKFEADIVHCEKYFQVENKEFSTDSTKFKADAIIKADFVNEPTLMTSDKSSRLKDFANEKFDWSTCTNFIRRDFVSENKLEFLTDIQSFEDAVFAVKFLCRADKILKVPNAIYFYRRHSESVTKSDLPAEKRVHRAVSNAGFVLKEFDKIFDELDKPEDIVTKFTLFEMTLRRLLNVVLPVYAQIPVYLIDPFIRRELEKIDDKKALTAFLFSRMNIFNLQINRQNAMLYQMDAHIKKQNQLLQQQNAQIQQLQAQLKALQS